MLRFLNKALIKFNKKWTWTKFLTPSISIYIWDGFLSKITVQSLQKLFSSNFHSIYFSTKETFIASVQQKKIFFLFYLIFVRSKKLPILYIFFYLLAPFERLKFNSLTVCLPIPTLCVCAYVPLIRKLPGNSGIFFFVRNPFIIFSTPASTTFHIPLFCQLQFGWKSPTVHLLAKSFHFKRPLWIPKKSILF